MNGDMDKGDRLKGEPTLNNGKDQEFEVTDDEYRLLEDQVRKFFSLSPDMFCAIDGSGTISGTNRAFQKFVGYAEKELIGCSFVDFVHPKEQSETASELIKKIATRVPLYNLEHRCRHQDGTYRWIFWSTVPSPVRGLAYTLGRDTTDHKHGEEVLRESREMVQRQKEFFKKAMDTVAHPFYVIDPNTYEIIQANASLGIGNLTPHSTCFALTHGRSEPCGGAEHPCPVQEIRRTKKPVAVEHIHRYQQEEEHLAFVELHGYPVLDDNGDVVQIIMHALDVTRRRQAEEALIESEAKNRSAMEALPDPFLVCDLEGRVTLLNPAFTRVFGWTAENIIGKELDFVPPDLQAEQDGLVASMLSGETLSAFETRRRTKTGVDVYVSISGGPFRDQQGKPKGFVLNLHNVTAVRKAEEERVRLVTAIESAAEDIVVTDAEGIIEYVNPAFERVTGYSRTEAVGQDLQTLTGGKHGKLIYHDPWKTIGQGNVWKGRITNKRKDGKLVEGEATISPIYDPAGQITGYVWVKRDITEQTQLEAQLIRSQKMEAIGTLAGGIAHDFNNILGAIVGYTELARMEVEDGNAPTGCIEEVLKATGRARRLVQQILSFSRQSEQEKRPLKVEQIIKEALELLRASLPTTIEIRQKLIHEGGAVLADSTQIHQVLMNLCTNAAHAMREKGGILEVSLDTAYIKEDSEQEPVGLTSGKYRKLSVTDTGHGMDTDTLNRIFDPFFTTKNKGEGTGMGLAVVHGIVKSHGGVIRACSEPGKGSQFHVYLPLMKSEMQAYPVPADVKPIPMGTERLLLVDDEGALADIGLRMLERLGYEVTTRTSSLEALQLFKNRPDAFDLVITDQTMPRMTGIQLAGEILKARPDIPIILCTGFSEQVSETNLSSFGIERLIMKPLLIREVAEAIREVLEQNESS